MHTALQHIQAPVPNEKRLCRLTRQRKEVKHPGCLNPTHHLHRTLYTSFCTAAFHKPHKAASLSFPPHKAACSCKCACCPDAKVPYTLQSHAHTLYKPHKAASLTFPPRIPACSCKCACCPDAKFPYSLQSQANTFHKPHKAAPLTFPPCVAACSCKCACFP